jgi:hypothetical protein
MAAHAGDGQNVGLHTRAAAGISGCKSEDDGGRVRQIGWHRCKIGNRKDSILTEIYDHDLEAGI